MSIADKYKIEKVRLIHNAFKKDTRTCVASYIPSCAYIDPHSAMHELYSKTQNIDESWVREGVCGSKPTQFSKIPLVETRSTSVGDIMVVCYPSSTGRGGYREVWYQVSPVGFEKFLDVK